MTRGMGAFMKPSFISTLTIIFLGVALPVRADRIVLDSGREIRGVVENRSEKTIELRTAAGKINMPLSRMREHVVEPARVNELLDAEFKILNSLSAEGLPHAQRAVEMGLTPEELREWLLGRADAFQSGLVAADGPTRAAWAGLIRKAAGLPPTAVKRDFTKPNWDEAMDGSPGDEAETAPVAGPDPGAASRPSIPFLIAMAGLLHAIDQRPAALDLLELVPPLDLRIASPAEPFILELMLDQLRETLNQHDFERASSLIRRMEEARFGVGESTRILLGLRWAAFERGRLNYDAALVVLRDRVLPLSPELGNERMRSALIESRPALAAQGRYQDAIELNSKWGREVLGQGTESVQAELYREWGDKLLGEKKFAQAREAFLGHRRLAPAEAPEAASRLIDNVDFQERFHGLKAHQYADAWELGQWAEEKGLHAQAIQSYERAMAHEALRESAQKRVHELRRNVAIERLDDCLTLYERGDPGAALRQLSLVEGYSDAPDVLDRVTRLRTLCSRELQRRLALRPVQAQTLLEDARRRYALGENEPVLSDLEIIIRQYQDTEAAGQAAELMERVAGRMDMERLEGAVKLPPEAAPAQAPDSAVEREVQKLLRELRLTNR
jgi:hypothetical protein